VTCPARRTITDRDGAAVWRCTVTEHREHESGQQIHEDGWHLWVDSDEGAWRE
jgi:hypothetical protein